MSGFFDKLLYRDGTCPWWLCFTFDNPLRALFQNPVKILRPYVRPGCAALDIGPGMGYFTFPLAALAGPEGRVVGLDIQERMLARLGAKVEARKPGNVELKLYDGGSFGLEGKFDFVLLFWMFHEVRDKEPFLREIGAVLGDGGTVLVVEPRIHVTTAAFEAIPAYFGRIGLAPVSRPEVSLSRAFLFSRK